MARPKPKAAAPASKPSGKVVAKAAPAKERPTPPAETAPLSPSQEAFVAIEPVPEAAATLSIGQDAASSSAVVAGETPAAPEPQATSPAPSPALVALQVRETELTELQTCLEVREKALRSLELQLAGQLDELALRQQQVVTRESALVEREDEISIREAALDEAMSLEQVLGAGATTSAPAPVSAPAPLQAHEDAFLEGPADQTQFLLEGPGEVLDSPSVVQPSAEVIEAEVRKALLGVRELQQKKLADEIDALLRIIGSLPFLNFVEPRIRKAQVENQIDVENTLGFFNLSVRLLREEYDRLVATVRRMEELNRENERALGDAQKASESLRDDFERFRARQKNEQEGMSARASESLLHKIVPVVDNFDRALKASASASSVESVLSGVQMIYRMFDDVLTQGGLVPIKADLGSPFEPKTQEASEVVETDEYPEDTICQVVQRGYMLAGKVFRPALVKVARPVSPGYRPVADPLA